MKKLLLITLSLMITFALSAQVIHVPNDYSTIQQGIDAANNGDTVLVDNGTYYENINFLGKAITVASNFILDGDTNHINNTVIDGSQAIHIDSASVVTFRSGEDTTSVLAGFTVTGGSGTEFSVFLYRNGGGIFIDESGAKIIHNKIIGNSIVHDRFSAGGGISCTNKDEDYWVVIENNTIKQNSLNADLWAGGGGISVSSSARIFGNNISGNEVICIGTDKQSEGGGIYSEEMGTQDDVIITDNIIAYNTVNSDFSRGAGIQVYNSQTIIMNNDIHNNQTIGKRAAGSAIGFYFISGNILVKNNHIFNNQHNVDSMGAAVITMRELLNPAVTIEIRNNSIYNNTNDADNSWTAPIWLWDFKSHEVIIDGNHIHHNSGGKAGGFYARDSYNYKLTNNVFDHNYSDQWGGVMYFHQYNPGVIQTRSLIANNTFMNNEADYYAGVIYFTSAYDSLCPVIMNNIFWQNNASTGNDIYYWGAEDILVYNNDIKKDEIIGNWTGHGNIDEDPLFIDTLCHISGGPCHNTGIDELTVNGVTYFAPDIDFDGTPRPQGAEWDIGADECLMIRLPEFIEQNSSFNIFLSPNPTSKTTTLSFQLKERKEVSINLFSMQGELVESIHLGIKQAGEHHQKLDLSQLPDGVYLLRLCAGEEVESAKIILQK